jgi:hypothetical protein
MKPFWFQIKSNQLVKFSKIQNINARQQGQVLMIKLVFKKNLPIEKNDFICIMENRVRIFKVIL